MKKSWLSLLLCTLSSQAFAGVVFYDNQAAMNAVTPTHVIENFDTPDDLWLPYQFQRGQLSFIANAGQPVIIGSNSVYDNFGSNLNPFRGTVLTANGNEDFTVRFLDGNKRAASFDLIVNGLGPAHVDVLSGAQVLGRLDIPNIPGGAYRFVGFSSNVAFDGFRWSTTSGGLLNTAMDNIAVQAVPEPQTWVMLLAGLGGLGVLTRRRQALSSER